MIKALKKCFSIILILSLIASIISVHVLAANVDSFSYIADYETGNTEISFQFGSLAGESISATVFDPSVDAQTQLTDWMSSGENKPVYLTQVTLNENGNGMISFVNRQPVRGNYSVAFGTKDGTVIESFHYLKQVDCPSITADKDVYEVNENINLTVYTATDVTKVGLLNENNRYITKLSSTVTDEYDVRRWDIVISVATKGERTVELCTMTEGSALTGTGKYVQFKAVPKINDSVTEDPVKIISAAAESNFYKINEPITITVKTTKSVAKLGVFNETGRGIVSKSSYVDSGDERIWTVTFSVGTKGVRSFTVKPAGKDYVYSAEGVLIENINVYKL